MKFFTPVAIVLCLLFLSISKTDAVTQETVNPIVSVNETVTVQSDKIAQVELQLEIQNQSDKNLISEIQISTGFENLVLNYSTTKKTKVDKGNLQIDYFTNPINTKSSRSEYIKFSVPNFYNDLNGMKRVYIKKLDTSASLSTYNLNIQYPASWQSVSYSSRAPAQNNIGYLTFSGNENIYLVWGYQSTLGVSAKYTVSKAKDLLPLIQGNAFQESSYNSLSGANNLYFDIDKNAFITTHEGQVDISSQLIINANNTENYNSSDKRFLRHQGLELTKISGDNNTAKLEQIISTLKSKYKFTKRTELKSTANSFEGDEYNLALLTTNWLRQSDVPAFVYMGWDLGLNSRPDKNNFSYWVVWFDGDKFVSFDMTKYVKGEINIYNSSNPDRVILLSCVDFDGSFEKLYENITTSSFQPSFSTSQSIILQENLPSDKQVAQNLIDININWLESDSWINRFHGVLNVSNKTRQLFNVDSLKVNNEKLSINSEDELEHLQKGVLPGSYNALDIWYSGSIFDIGKKKMLLDTQITYQLGQHNYNYTNSQTVKSLVLNSDLIKMERILIIFAFIVLTYEIFVVTKKYLAIPVKIIKKKLNDVK